jgi:hypothetical protein
MYIHNSLTTNKYYKGPESGLAPVETPKSTMEIIKGNLPGLIVQKSDKREFSEEPKSASKNPNHLSNLGILAGSILAVNSVNINPQNFNTDQIKTGSVVELSVGEMAEAAIDSNKAKSLASEYRKDGKLPPEVKKAVKEKDQKSIDAFNKALADIAPHHKTAQEERAEVEFWVELVKWTGGIGLGIIGTKKLVYNPAKKFLGKFGKKNNQENTEPRDPIANSSSDSSNQEQKHSEEVLSKLNSGQKENIKINLEAYLSKLNIEDLENLGDVSLVKTELVENILAEIDSKINTSNDLTKVESIISDTIAEIPMGYSVNFDSLQKQELKETLRFATLSEVSNLAIKEVASILNSRIKVGYNGANDESMTEEQKQSRDKILVETTHQVRDLIKSGLTDFLGQEGQDKLQQEIDKRLNKNQFQKPSLEEILLVMENLIREAKKKYSNFNVTITGIFKMKKELVNKGYIDRLISPEKLSKIKNTYKGQLIESLQELYSDQIPNIETNSELNKIKSILQEIIDVLFQEKNKAQGADGLGLNENFSENPEADINFIINKLDDGSFKESILQKITDFYKRNQDNSKESSNGGYEFKKYQLTDEEKEIFELVDADINEVITFDYLKEIIKQIRLKYHPDSVQGEGQKNEYTQITQNSVYVLQKLLRKNNIGGSL